MYDCDFEQVITILKDKFAIYYSKELRGMLKLIKIDFVEKVIVFEVKSFGVDTIVIYPLFEVGRKIRAGEGTP